MDIVESIKKIAHRAAENYLLSGVSMNDIIYQAHTAGEVVNDEVLKRICEQANQNVYLSLFSDPSVDKTNIKFEMADWNEILVNTKQRETEMREYDTPPTDFRMQLIPESTESYKEASAPSEFKKLGALNQLINYRDRLEKLAGTFESMRISETSGAEDAFLEMSHDAKLLVANSESLGDMAKIAARVTVEMGLGFDKVASAYTLIQEDLRKHGFSVNTEFTKVSSLHIDSNAKVLEPVKKFVIAIEKAAAFREMRDAVLTSKSRIDAMSNIAMKALRR